MPMSSEPLIVARNKRARNSYVFQQYFTCGIVLKGYEVKSVKAGHIDLRDSFARVEKGEVWLLNAHVSPWKHADISQYEPKRRRKLLLTKREIQKLVVLQDGKNLSIIPLEVFVQKGKIKLKIGVGKGRKKYDKRKKLKERDMKKQLRDELALKERF
jgi:SsrA-binding protein